jgi:thymidylate synthase
MNNIDKQYLDLLQDILDNGVEKKDRTGTGTLSVFGRQIRHKMSEGFPLLTTKKMAWKTIVTELLWFLRGETNIKFLQENGCFIWNGDYDKSGRTDGELGPIYGAQWRKWTTYEQNTKVNGVYDERMIDQIANLIDTLKTNPDSRRLMVSAWNVGELDQMVLPPCHYGFQVYTRELSIKERLDLAYKTYSVFEPSDFIEATHEEIDRLYPVPSRGISLMWNQRSVDTFLGLPFNIASYALLLEIIAGEVNMIPDELIGNLGDVHLYSNHIEQAKEQIGRDLTYEERYRIWFNSNYETGMEYNPLSIPDFDNGYYVYTPKRVREPYELPNLVINTEFWNKEAQTIDGWIQSMQIEDFQLPKYQSHSVIKAPLSN